MIIAIAEEFIPPVSPVVVSLSDTLLPANEAVVSDTTNRGNLASIRSSTIKAIKRSAFLLGLDSTILPASLKQNGLFTDRNGGAQGHRANISMNRATAKLIKR